MLESRWETFKRWFNPEPPKAYHIRNHKGLYLAHDGSWVRDMRRGRVVKGLDAAWDIVEEIDPDTEEISPYPVTVIVR